MARRFGLPILPLVGVVALVLEACLPPPPVMVHSGRVGQKSDEELGSVVQFERFPEEPRAKAKEGFTAIRSIDDWDLVFADVPKKNRPNAPSFDFEKNMMVFAYTSAEEVDKIRVHNMIASTTGLHVYMTETLRGKGCAAKKGAERGALEIASFAKTDRVIHVHLDIEEGEACDSEPLQGELVCKVVGTNTAVPRLTTSPGQKIDCTAGSAGVGVFDRNWTFAHLPKGSAAKFTILPEAVHVVFSPDVLGVYELALELSSADKKSGIFRGAVEVPPPNDLLYLESFWTKFDGNDDPNTFPRIELRAQEILEEGGKPILDKTGKSVLLDKAGKPQLTKEKLGKTCVLGGEKLSFCGAEKEGPNTLMRLSAGSGRYKITARYTDERFDGMPVYCVRTYAKTKETGEACDTSARKAGAVWTIGIASEKEGTFESEEEEAPPNPDAGDAGAPSKGDAGWSSKW